MRSFCILYFFLLSTLCFAQGAVFEKNESSFDLTALSHNTGVAIADYDNDGDLDFFIVGKRDDDLSNPTTWSRLYSNNNDGSFSDVSLEAGLSIIHDKDIEDPGWELGVKMGASWGDYNNDGNKDLLLTNYKGVQLFKNLGDGSFEESTIESGLPEIDSCYNYTALWWDFNKDRYLDLFIPNWKGCTRNKYYQNNGDETFTERAEELNLTGSQFGSLMSIPIDVNKDDRWDLFIANDFGINELFIQNPDGSFTDQAQEYGVDTYGNDMGMAIGDYDNNGEYDIYVTNIGENRLFNFNGSSYDNIAEEENVLGAFWAWDTRFVDFDLDGDEDLFVVNGYELDNQSFPNQKQNFYFENQLIQGEATFQDASILAGVYENTNSLSMGVFDFDYDGDHDVLMTNTNAQPIFYENKIIDQEPDENINWVNIHLEGTVSNRDGLGTYIDVWTQGQKQTRFHYGAGFLAQHQQPVHFGLGSAIMIDSIIVKWDSGLVDKYYNQSTNTNIKIIEGEISFLLNLGAQKILGCTDEFSCNYNPEATIDDNSCIYLTAPEIDGQTSSFYLGIDEFTCNAQSTSSTFKWKVDHGSIVSGQGTDRIKVQWGLNPNGQVEVVEVDDCLSESSLIDVGLSLQGGDQLSIARLWNEVLLEAIRNDYARPTVHSRNLFHASIIMYDIWSVFSEEARSYLLGKEVSGFMSDFEGFQSNESEAASINTAISYAMYRFLYHRFSESPGWNDTQSIVDRIFSELGFDSSFDSQDYLSGDPASLGNYMVQQMIDFGLQDGSNELQDYSNQHYQAVNDPLVINGSESIQLQDPNRWQPLEFETFIDQSGNVIEGTTPLFLSPEWGHVAPFSLMPNQGDLRQRDGYDYRIYFDPHEPPLLDTLSSTIESSFYKWGFLLVSIWGSHLDSREGVMWDISPNRIGNISSDDFPTSYDSYSAFYNLYEGGDASQGYATNPVTGQAYESQLVPRGDYARVLAEFWADGPDSETPPGHWFVLLNKVNDHPLLEKKLSGEGPTLSDLEWDVKSYFILGGAMHDAAIAAWSIKGWYDYIRPVSAIRYLAQRGQSSDLNSPNFDLAGIPLVPGFIELVSEEDPLVGVDQQHLHKIKLYTWRGHPFISNPESVDAGVDWILAENWLPYQRLSFVTPPFAGYVSGHSTFSRAAAETLTLLTGDEYFPGGLGEFYASANEYLVFEDGPSQDVILQWAKYKDASDQCSLSRIWGGIHPPADDIPGRLIGEEIGKQAFNYAVPYFSSPSSTSTLDNKVSNLFPNPIPSNGKIIIEQTSSDMLFKLHNMAGMQFYDFDMVFDSESKSTAISFSGLPSGVYAISAAETSWKFIVL